MRLLLENNAEPDQEALDDSATPLFVSARNSHQPVVELLLKHGADHSKALTADAADEPGISEQVDAAASNALSMLTQMYRNEMTALMKAQKGDTPLIAAIQSDAAGIVRLLLAANADPNKKISETRESPFTLACEIDAEDCLAAITEYNHARTSTN